MSDQDKREQVINGLECCKQWSDAGIYEGYQPVLCESCPRAELQIDVEECHEALLNDAIALLKAQEPRVMTLDEVKMLNSDYYYLESMRSPGKELREIVGAYCLECVTWPSITWARQTMGDSGYGKTWRCWTSRPTDEQRKKVMWG